MVGAHLQYHPRRLRGERHRRAAQGRPDISPERHGVGAERPRARLGDLRLLGRAALLGLSFVRQIGSEPWACFDRDRVPSEGSGLRRYSSARITKKTAATATAMKKMT